MTKKSKIIIAVAAAGVAAAFFLLRKKKEDTRNVNAIEPAPSNSIGTVAEAQGLIKPGLATQSIVRSPLGSTRLGNSI